MNKIRNALILLCCIGGIGQLLGAATLQEAFESASAADGYDKVLILETGVTYTGGLLIGNVLNLLNDEVEGDDGCDVKIVGNGAILDLQGGQICISYCNHRLDIEDCIILNGNVRFRGYNWADGQAQPTGSVRYVTFYRPHDYGIRLQGAGEGVLLERNIVVDAQNTGEDYIFSTGLSSPWIPTGTNISFSVQSYYGYPIIQDNWSYHSDDVINSDSLHHFSML